MKKCQNAPPPKKRSIITLGAPAATQLARLVALAGPSGKPTCILPVLDSGNPPPGRQILVLSSMARSEAGKKSPSTQAK